MSENNMETKYDYKISEGKKLEKKNRMAAAVLKTAAIMTGLAIVIGLGASVVISRVDRNAALKDTYMVVGKYNVTKMEYDYYGKCVRDNYSVLWRNAPYYTPVLNIYPRYRNPDIEKRLDEKMYSAGMTWKDYYDLLTVNKIRQTKGLVDDAAANHFSYDITADYNTLIDRFKGAGRSILRDITLADYIKHSYGTYATQNNIRHIMEESILAGAYYNHLIEENTPDDQEIQEYYQANILDYDKVDYRSFVFPAGVVEGAEGIAVSMTVAKNRANTMMKARQSGKDFRELCFENAEESDKSLYESTDSDGSLSEGCRYYSVPSEISFWLYGEGRQAGDITVIEDSASHQYYVVEFIDRYFDEADNERISYNIAKEKTMEYVNALAEGYEVTDCKGELYFLTLDQEVLDGEPLLQECRPKYYLGCYPVNIELLH